jgi:hypothetical protein
VCRIVGGMTNHTSTPTMTSRDLGGPCDPEHPGATADEVIKLQDRHLKDAVAAGDTTHQAAHQAMQGRWRRPISGLRWYKEAKREFAARAAG